MALGPELGAAAPHARSGARALRSGGPGRERAAPPPLRLAQRLEPRWARERVAAPHTMSGPRALRCAVEAAPPPPDVVKSAPPPPEEARAACQRGDSAPSAPQERKKEINK